MKLFSRVVLALAAAATLSACASVGARPQRGAKAATAPQQLTTAAILSGINEARRANGGHKPMSYNPALEAACAIAGQADGRARTSWRTISGVKLRERVTDRRLCRRRRREHRRRPADARAGAIEGWLNSPGHRATLLSDKFVEFGLAVGPRARRAASRATASIGALSPAARSRPVREYASGSTRIVRRCVRLSAIGGQRS